MRLDIQPAAITPPGDRSLVMEASKRQGILELNRSKTGRGEEVISPLNNKENTRYKRKEGPTADYKPKQLLLTAAQNPGDLDPSTSTAGGEDDEDLVHEPKKKRPTPDNSAETVDRSCPAQ